MREPKWNTVDRSDEPGTHNQRWNALIHNLSERNVVGASTTSTCPSRTSMPAKRRKRLRDLTTLKGLLENEHLPQLQPPAPKLPNETAAEQARIPEVGIYV